MSLGVNHGEKLGKMSLSGSGKHQSEKNKNKTKQVNFQFTFSISVQFPASNVPDSRMVEASVLLRREKFRIKQRTYDEIAQKRIRNPHLTF